MRTRSRLLTLIGALLAVVLLFVATSRRAEGQLSSSARTPVVFHTDASAKGDSVSITITADDKILFVAIVDKEKGLRIDRIPTDKVR